MVSDLSERARKDGEEAAQVKNERDELRQRDAEAHHRSLTSKGSLRRKGTDASGPGEGHCTGSKGSPRCCNG
jgi:hypothetical protein